MSEDSDDLPVKVGRPSSYSTELIDEICARLAEGRSMIDVCEDADMPDKSQVYRWLSKHEEFRDKYRACAEIRADAFAELLLKNAVTAQEGEQVTVRETEKGALRETRYIDNVPRSDLIARTLMWSLARMSPRKYGDKMQLDGKIDITKHYTDDDEAILNRHIEQKARELISNRKRSKPDDESTKNYDA